MKEFLLIILSVIGFIISYYILYGKRHKKKLVCIIGKGCNRVINSSYGKFFGIDNAILGMMYYVFILIVGLIMIFYASLFTTGIISFGIIILSGLAALFSIYLSVMQLIILKETCEYCWASSVLSILIFIILLF